MKSITVFLVLFFFVMLSSLVAHIPAHIAIGFIPDTFPFKVTGVEGKLWKGRAEKFLWLDKQFGWVEWDFSVSKLLLAKVEFMVRFGYNSRIGINGEGYVGYGLFLGPYIEDLEVSMPAEYVIDKYKVPVSFKAEGELKFAIHQLVYDAPYCQKGKSVLLWNTAKISSLLGDFNLGKIMAKLDCKNNVISIFGEQKSNQMSSEFGGKLEIDDRYVVDVWFRPKQGFPSGFKSTLKWMTKLDSEGRYNFSYQRNILN
ncbi:general secretion pathway protein N [Candidatus Photodesmus blepharus]|uniref:Type II secretion system protein N n=1 Tax=Candidatus Photodesmus blepharonis TaxID=1179155 RepID=A0A084CNK6_9GAMM|nr:type II secretion system protein N [Candidatus Photodesmus blepharus]KEY91385.1 general secretion pathway protein N [Candidatus Photodesmus blepharus]